MTKQIKVSFTKEQLDTLMEIIGSKFYEVEENSKEYKKYDKLHTELVKGMNKTGLYYKWQLIDRDGGVNNENLTPEWRKK